MATPQLRILFVDDEPDLKWLIANLLATQGYDVDTAGSAEEGFALIEKNHYDLVITDRHMPPGEDGMAMLEQAKPYLESTVTIVMTANPVDTGSYTVLTKPVDVDVFLRTVNDALEPARKRAFETVMPVMPLPSATNKIDFVLYISAASPASLKATRNMMKLVAQYRDGEIGLFMRDLAKDPIGPADADRVTFTPTLVRQGPGQKVWVVGDLENTSYVAGLIEGAGVQKK